MNILKRTYESFLYFLYKHWDKELSDSIEKKLVLEHINTYRKLLNEANAFISSKNGDENKC